MLLFDTSPRSDPGPRRHTESTYQFLNRCSKPGCDTIRAELERWFELYPSDHRAELKARFTSDFHSGFFELLLHQLLLQTEYAVQVEPDIPGSENHPDFLARRGGTQFYLEAAVATDKTDDERRSEAVENALLDAINKIHTPNFFINIRELEIPRGKQPSAKKLTAALQEYLEGLDPDALTEQLKSHGLSGLPAWKYRDETIRLQMEPVPKSPEARGKPGLRPIGIYPIQSRWGGTDRALRAKLADKAGKYGRLDCPYVIAVNSISEWGTERSEALEALFGTERVTFRPGEEPQLVRARDGLFIGPSGPRNTRVSAVLAATVWAWALPQSRIELFHHPWAGKPLDSEALPFSQVILENQVLVERSGEPVHRVLGLPGDWPIGPLTAGT